MHLAAVVEWRELENFSRGLGFKPKIISNITNLPPEFVNSFAGRVELASSIESDKSLLVHIKVRPQTEIRLRKGNKEFVRSAEGKDKIFYRGEMIDAENSAIPFLLNRLSMSKFLQNQGNQ